MFLHNKRLMYTVRVDEPDPHFAKLLMEQFGGANGELAAAMRYFTQAWNDPDGGRRGMLLDIATEELSHLEMVGQMLVMLLQGTVPAKVDAVEDSYLGKLMDGKGSLAELALVPGEAVLGAGGPRLTDSAGNPWTSAYVDTLGQPVADLQSDIAAEGRAKIVYERLIKYTGDAGCSDTLQFLMTREVAHQKMFEAALGAITDNFPPGQLQGDEKLGHTYFKTSSDSGGPDDQGFAFVEANSRWGFEQDTEVVAHAADQQVL
ncbi:MAG: manganese catalase family protein [Acidimicrobiales bacterium]